jgi:methionyl aminopeptidase
MLILRKPEEIEKIRVSNIMVAQTLEALKEKIAEGITTLELDRYAEELAHKQGARPAFKGYRGYPFSLCVSVNEEVVHGLPSQRVLKNGDLVSLDFGIYYKGYYGDAARTFAVGEIGTEAQRLMRVTEESLYLGIEEARVGNRLGDISAAVQNHVEKAGFSVVLILLAMVSVVTCMRTLRYRTTVERAEVWH